MDFRSLEIKISRSENLPVMPQIASSVLKLSDDPDSSPKDLERLIERDSAIAGKILRVANSSYYGLSQVSAIGRAISILGMNTIRSLVVGIAYQQVISAKQHSKRFSKVEFWRHSVATATAAKILGRLKQPMKAEELYSAALLHDVGLLVMDRFAPDELDQAITYAQSEGILLHQAEQLLFDFDHSQVGGLLAERWQLTPSMTAAIRYHHSPAEDTEFTEMTTFVSLANTLAHQCGFTNNVPCRDLELDEEAVTLIGVPVEQFTAIRAVVLNEVQKAEEALQIK